MDDEIQIISTPNSVGSDFFERMKSMQLLAREHMHEHKLLSQHFGVSADAVKRLNPDTVKKLLEACTYNEENNVLKLKFVKKRETKHKFKSYQTHLCEVTEQRIRKIDKFEAEELDMELDEVTKLSPEQELFLSEF